MTDQRGSADMPAGRLRSYWIYSAGLAIVWALVIAFHTVIGRDTTLRDTLLLFGGFALGWVSTTIARYIYPPPDRWQTYYRSDGQQA